MVSTGPIFRQNLYGATLAVAAVNALVRPVLASIDDLGWLAALSGGFGIGFVIPAALLLGLRLLIQTRADEVETLDWVLIVCALILLLVPSATVSWLVTAALAVFAMPRFRSPWARAGLSVVLFTALRDPLATTLLKLFATPLLDTDAAMTATLLKIFMQEAAHQGNVVIGQSGHQLLILTGCTSYTNLSMALLGWFALSRNFKPFLDRRQAAAGLAVATAVIGLNIVRLTIMALGPAPYHFFHDGSGGVMFEAALIAVTVGLTLLGVRNDETKQRHYLALRRPGYSWPRRQGHRPQQGA